MVIGVFVRGYKSVVLVVLWKQFPVEIVAKQHGCNPAYGMVDFFVGRDYAVHGIMGRNEKARVEVHLDQDCKIGQGIGPGNFPLEEKK